jgi:hypothetical protein
MNVSNVGSLQILAGQSGRCFWAPKCAPKKQRAFLSTAGPLPIFSIAPRLLSRLIATPKAFFLLNSKIELMEKLERILEGSVPRDDVEERFEGARIPETEMARLFENPDEDILVFKRTAEQRIRTMRNPDQKAVLLEILEDSRNRSIIDYALLEKHGFGCQEIVSDNRKGGVGLWVAKDIDDQQKYDETIENGLMIKEENGRFYRRELQLPLLNLIGVELVGVTEGNIKTVLERMENRFFDDLDRIDRIVADPTYPLDMIEGRTLIIGLKAA